jgi:hypothetical protein
MIKAGVGTAMITTRAVPALSSLTACRRSSAPTHRDFAEPLLGARKELNADVLDGADFNRRHRGQGRSKSLTTDRKSLAT